MEGDYSGIVNDANKKGIGRRGNLYLVRKLCAHCTAKKSEGKLIAYHSQLGADNIY
jgi:hypothetical protein